MKKMLFVLGLVLGLVTASSATIVTNMNQSAMYLRLLSRNASTDIDAVYYNPAGLTRLADGWHVGLNNQTVFRTNTVVNDFPYLNNHQYDGKITVPIYPGIYVAYKKGPLALSFGFCPSAGGGTADYAKGLPSFEWVYSAVPLMISSMGIPTSGYTADIAFKGSSIYLGFQFNVSYAFTDELSGAFGLRYVNAFNHYEGHIRSVMVNPTYPAIGLTGSYIPAATFFTMVGQPAYAAMMGNQTIDADQAAQGVTPILSLNYAPLPNLNLAVKYEFVTKLTFQNLTKTDTTGSFPNGVMNNDDVPAFLSVGVEWLVLPAFKVTASYNYFFDKDADWAGREKYVNNNSYDAALGVEYAVTDCLALSAGYLYTRYDLAPGFQSDQAFSLGANSYGGGARIKISKAFDVDLSVMNSVNTSAQKLLTFITPTGSNMGSYLEHYSQKSFVFAVGLNFHL
jgi:long-chain fatty acid transport protein